MSEARRAQPGPSLTVIGGDLEDDEAEAPTVLARDLDSLGISHLNLVQPSWEQPSEVSDADTAPTGPSPVVGQPLEPLDPARTFPEEDELDDADLESLSPDDPDALVQAHAPAPSEPPAPQTHPVGPPPGRSGGAYAAVVIMGGLVGLAGLASAVTVAWWFLG